MTASVRPATVAPAHLSLTQPLLPTAFSAATPIPLTGGGAAPSGAHIGPTKGLVVPMPGGKVRLMLPGEGCDGRACASSNGASIYSDNHGASWSCKSDAVASPCGKS